MSSVGRARRWGVAAERVERRARFEAWRVQDGWVFESEVVVVGG